MASVKELRFKLKGVESIQKITKFGFGFVFLFSRFKSFFAVIARFIFTKVKFFKLEIFAFLVLFLLMYLFLLSVDGSFFPLAEAQGGRPLPKLQQCYGMRDCLKRFWVTSLPVETSRSFSSSVQKPFFSSDDNILVFDAKPSLDDCRREQLLQNKALSPFYKHYSLLFGRADNAEEYRDFMKNAALGDEVSISLFAYETDNGTHVFGKPTTTHPFASQKTGGGSLALESEQGNSVPLDYTIPFQAAAKKRVASEHFITLDVKQFQPVSLIDFTVPPEIRNHPYYIGSLRETPNMYESSKLLRGDLIIQGKRIRIEEVDLARLRIERWRLQNAGRHPKTCEWDYFLKQVSSEKK